MRARHLFVFLYLFIGNYTLIDSATGFYRDLLRAEVIPSDWKLIVLQLIFDLNILGKLEIVFYTHGNQL